MYPSAFPPPESPPVTKLPKKENITTKIEIINGVYTRDEEAMTLLTSGEDEHMAAIAQKLVIRQEPMSFS